METTPSPQPQPAKPSAIRRWGLPLTALLLVVITVFATQSSASSAQTTLIQATSKQPEKLTELYFNPSGDLPKSLSITAPSTFTYHVTNQELRNLRYSPVITIIEAGHARVLQSDQFTLPSGQGRDTVVKFTPLLAGVDIELVVSLPEQNESIHFRGHS